MKRFASLATSTALAGALLIAGSASKATTNYAMYLQPISSSTVTPGAAAVFTFRALIDIPAQDANNNGTISLTLGPAVTYTTVVTGPTPPPGPGVVTNRGKFKFAADKTEFPGLPGSGTATWDQTGLPNSFSTTTSGVLTFQGSVGHTKQSDPNTGSVVTVPAGTYTIGTYTIPITNAGELDITLPGSIGLNSGPNGARDFINNTSGDANGVVSTNDAVLSFPNDGKTKFSTLVVNKASTGTGTPAPSSLLVVAMGAVPMVGVLRRRRSLKK